MKKNLTEIVFILDESGSMYSLKNDTVGGFNSLIEKQKNEDGEALISTVMFSTDSHVVHDRVPLEKINVLSEKDYCPNGNTALLDAVGNAIQHISTVHKYAREEDRPERTLFVITTDGMENASRVYSQKKIKEMIEKQKKEHDWEFIFLGANIDAAETAADMGIEKETAVNYAASTRGTSMLYSSIAHAVSNVRKGINNSCSSAWREELDEEYSRNINKTK